MINFEGYVNKTKTELNSKQPNILDHPYRILIIGGHDLEKQMHY